MPILSQHRDVSAIIKGDDRGRTRMPNHREVDLDAIGKRGMLDADIDHSQFQNLPPLGIHL